MNIYADVVFLINLLMNFLIFWIVSKLIKEKVKKFRIFVGALLGASIYSVMIFIPTLREFYNFFSVILVLVVSLFTTFGFLSFKRFAKLIFFAHMVAFMVGGMGIAIYSYTNVVDVFDSIVRGSHYFSFKVLIVSAFLSYLIIKFGHPYIKKTLIMKQTFYNVKIFMGDVSVDILALVDTGNSLTEPISKLPVIVAEFKSIKDFLPPKIQLLFYEKKENDFVAVTNSISESEMVNKMRIIPFKSIGKESGILIGFKPDKIEIMNTESVVKVEDVFIGIFNLNLSANGDYQGLLSPKLLND